MRTVVTWITQAATWHSKFFRITEPLSWMPFGYDSWCNIFMVFLLLTQASFWRSNRVACKSWCNYAYATALQCAIRSLQVFAHELLKCLTPSVLMWNQTCNIDTIGNVDNQYFKITLIQSSCMKRTCVHPRSSNIQLCVFKQGKSKGFDSCDRPSNLTKIKIKSSNFLPV